MKADLPMWMILIGIIYRWITTVLSSKILLKDLKKLKQSNLKQQFQSVIEILKRNPYYPDQSFEKVQPKHLGFYSSRLNQQHRIVYKINEIDRRVQIYSA